MPTFRNSGEMLTYLDVLKNIFYFLVTMKQPPSRDFPDILPYVSDDDTKQTLTQYSQIVLDNDLLQQCDYYHKTVLPKLIQEIKDCFDLPSFADDTLEDPFENSLEDPYLDMYPPSRSRRIPSVQEVTERYQVTFHHLEAFLQEECQIQTVLSHYIQHIVFYQQTMIQCYEEQLDTIQGILILLQQQRGKEYYQTHVLPLYRSTVEDHRERIQTYKQHPLFSSYRNKKTPPFIQHFQDAMQLKLWIYYRGSILDRVRDEIHSLQRHL
jgi:hypothetical protein